MSAAREAVARAMAARVLGDPDMEGWDFWLVDADAALAALRPIIAAEIREYAKQADESWQEIGRYGDNAVVAAVRSELDDLAQSADEIASRITTAGGTDE